jgi:hypothetical protein
LTDSETIEVFGADVAATLEAVATIAAIETLTFVTVVLTTFPLVVRTEPFLTKLV